MVLARRARRRGKTLFPLFGQPFPCELLGRGQHGVDPSFEPLHRFLKPRVNFRPQVFHFGVMFLHERFDTDGLLGVEIQLVFQDAEDAVRHVLTMPEDFHETVVIPPGMEGRAAPEAVLSRFFTGRIHHHVTTAHSFDPA